MAFVTAKMPGDARSGWGDRPEHKGTDLEQYCPTAQIGSENSRVPSADLEDIDRTLRFLASHFTLGLAPSALIGAFLDWWTHLVVSPGRQLVLAGDAWKAWEQYTSYVSTCALRETTDHKCLEPAPNDRRFSSPGWQTWPFNAIHQGFLLQQQWWDKTATGVRGVTKQHERQVRFAMRQLLDIFSPANYVVTNPEVLQRTQEEFGRNLWRGTANWLDDIRRLASGEQTSGTDTFKVGVHLAVTPGRVVCRNRLIELIQYTPTSERVRPEPILITPAWIMKYYILDLRPENSLVRYLVSRGFTVFMISWTNPGRGDRDLTLESYRQFGVEAALDAIAKLMPSRNVHGVGYCLGGTLLAIAAAAQERDRCNRFATLSFFAAQVDFEDAGELTLFISEAQVAFLEDMMAGQGYLDAHQMAGAFQILRSNDLIWSRIIHDYLIGERRPAFDLMAWNADATRLPARMHSEYLRKLFLDNDLAEGRYWVGDRPIALTDIRSPVFAVATETDHVAPWRSVYKFHLLLDTGVTFLLTSGGHNTGIVAPPGPSAGSYRIKAAAADARYLDPDSWLGAANARHGSWWPEWCQWLEQRSGDGVPPSNMALDATNETAAPGTYVLQR